MDSGQGLVGPFRSVERLLKLCWRHFTEVAVQAGVVVPVDPAQGGQLDVLDCLPRSSLAGGAADEFGFVVAVDRLGQCVVVGISDGADRGFAPIEYLEAWGPPDIAFGGQQYCRWGPVIASVGTTGPISGITY